MKRVHNVRGGSPRREGSPAAACPTLTSDVTHMKVTLPNLLDAQQDLNMSWKA